MAPDEPAARHRATAAALLPLLGGAGNVLSVANCMTRLRLELRDRALVRHAELRALPAVLGVVEDGTSYQVVLGPGTVARVAPELARLAAGPGAVPGPATEAGPVTSEPVTAAPVTAAALAERGAALRAGRKARNATPVKLLLRRVAAVFVPLIPALIGCGVVAGLAGLLANLRWLPALAPGLAAVASGFMSLIAVFVGYNAAKEFGGTPVLGGAVAAVVVYPGVERVNVFGERLAPGQGGVLGALAAAVLAAYVERWCRTWVPEALDVLLTPTLTVLVAGFTTLYGLMFVAGEVSTAIGRFTDRLLGEGGAAAGFVLGGLFLPLVMLGLHQALIPIHTTLIQQQGHTVLLPVLAMAGAGQVGAALAVYVRLARNGSVRRTIRSALPAGLLGVGEPLIYGVSLPLGRPFVTACVGGAFGGGFVGLLGQLGHAVGSTAIGPSGWALFPLLRGNHGPGPAVAVYGAGLLVGYATGFAATYFFGFGKGRVAELNAGPETPEGGTPTVGGTALGRTGAAPDHRTESGAASRSV
ncbi:PTS transporter subunit EIIC [Streptomyces eurocidicus]|uniref:PTS system sucrose-specific IIC component n=1 Tax=Streptomyces eurocidicus TaxID=66423 RepID=A0A7W8B805_STREU|nr:PTS transporter subunit EIIC [Streptomyces eurocidicus]MBB5118043.1 PTS system sucrose-specific IIC component [Streptomyces eurocidicus]MBF6054017.1 PTS alpha-glucoside transporter subunit IIA [Streptomyces eurocidicus]